jgi:hypothetical protein
MLVTFSTLYHIRHLWHLKMVIFLHRYLMSTVLNIQQKTYYELTNDILMVERNPYRDIQVNFITTGITPNLT